MTSAAKSPYAGHRFPSEVISHAVWLYFRFPLSLRMVEEMLAARGIDVSHETVRRWARKFGQGFAHQIRRKLPDPGDKWHLDEVCLMISGKKHWLWRAVDQESPAWPLWHSGQCALPVPHASSRPEPIKLTVPSTPPQRS